MSYGIGLHDYDCECPRCKSRREEPQGEPSPHKKWKTIRHKSEVNAQPEGGECWCEPIISPPAQTSAPMVHDPKRGWLDADVHEKLTAGEPSAGTAREWRKQHDFVNWTDEQVEAFAAQQNSQLVKLNNTLATINLTVRQGWEREVKELRQERDALKRKLEAK